MTTTTYAYVRVSTNKQEYERQLNILKERGYTDAVVYTETFTGTKKSRPVWDELLNNLKKGDTVVFESLSRVGRSTLNVLETIKTLVNEFKVNVIILKENFNFMAGVKNDAITDLMLNMFAAFAQFERDMTAERTREALQAKKAAGVKLGKKANTEHDEQIKSLLSRGLSQRKVAEKLGLTRALVRRVAESV